MSKMAPRHFPGEVLGRITLIRQTTTSGDNAKWLCICSCGWMGEKFSNQLRTKAAKGDRDVPRCKKNCASVMAEKRAWRGVWKNTGNRPHGRYKRRKYVKIGTKMDHLSSWARFFGISRQRMDDLWNRGVMGDWLERNYDETKLKGMGIKFNPKKKIVQYDLEPVKYL